jgi:4-cresol dehydrogenase (hydroxylating) flavoprotein subunit
VSATLPPGLSDEAIARFTAALGADAVLLEEADRDEYRDPYWFKDDRTYDSSAVLLPSSTEEVQALVRIANELGVALWTSSRGKNLGYGGPSPRVRGSAVVSLVRMNRVVEINAELAYAVVEPGVRWFDLHAALQEAGHDDLLVTIPDLGWGSVVGNSLDNGITYMPYGQDFMAPCGMEVVLADGELVRTGMGAMPDNKTWHLYKRGLGPVLDPLFIQSNYGIVTRMGYWLMRRPEAFAPLFLTVPRHDQLEQAIDILRELRLDGTIRGVPSMYSTLTLAAQFPEIMGEFVADGGVLADEQIQEIADRTGLGRWGMRAAIWGDAPVAAHHVEKVKAAWSALDGAQVIHERTFTKDDWDEIAATPDKIHAGIPNLDLMDAIPPNVGHLGFSPVVPLVGSDVRGAVDFMTELITQRAGVNFIGGILVINERSCVIVTGVNFDVTNEEVTKKAYATAKMLVEESGRHGYGEYRAHLDFMDLASDQYSFNDHAYRRFCERIKDAVDPNGILSPGRHGIWPEGMRDR